MTKENYRNTSDGNEREGDRSSVMKGDFTYRMHLPGFLTEEEIRLSDVVRRTASYFWIKLCEGCKRRTATLNRWLVFTRRQSK
jgi:hypothetical protein